MPAPSNSERVTGETRYRSGLFGKLILQVEEIYTSGYHGVCSGQPYEIMSTRWRDARLSDLDLIAWHEKEARTPRVLPTTGSGGKMRAA